MDHKIIKAYEEDFAIRNIYLAEAPDGFTKVEAIDAHEAACDAARDFNDYWRIQETIAKLVQYKPPEMHTYAEESLLCNGWSALATPAFSEGVSSVIRRARKELLRRRAERLRGRLLG